MPIPDPDKIWPKLDEIGIDEVRKKIAMGVYADYKLPVIEEWLRRKGLEVKNDSNKTDRTIKSLKNHPLISALIIISIIVIGLANFTDALTKLSKYIPHLQDEVNLSSIPGETGWIFAGYFNIKKEVFIEGPYVSVVKTTSRGLRKYVELGDIININVSRKVHVIDYKTTQAKKNLLSPVNKKGGVIEKSDETGLVLPTGYELIVKDISEGHFPGKDNAALWLRVSNVPK